MPNELRQFVRANFRSVLQLEILLVLARSPDRWWTTDELSLELRFAKDAAHGQLSHLVANGLSEKKDGDVPRFRYKPQDSAADELVRELMVLHQHRFHAIVDLIYTNRAKEFASAFMLRRDREDDDG